MYNKPPITKVKVNPYKIATVMASAPPASEATLFKAIIIGLSSGFIFRSIVGNTKPIRKNCGNMKSSVIPTFVINEAFSNDLKKIELKTIERPVNTGMAMAASLIFKPSFFTAWENKLPSPDDKRIAEISTARVIVCWPQKKPNFWIKPISIIMKPTPIRMK